MGECTQCSSTNKTECRAGSAKPACVMLVGECGCNSTADCGPGQVCDSGQPPAGQCVPALDGGAGDSGTGDGGARDGGALDGGPKADGGAGKDGGAVGDAGRLLEGGGGDGGQANPDTGDVAGGGCACHAAGRRGERGEEAALAGLLIGLAAWIGRRRRS
jgi:hypothetical protein